LLELTNSKQKVSFLYKGSFVEEELKNQTGCKIYKYGELRNYVYGNFK